MSIQILPQAATASNDLANKLGPALQGGIERGMEQGLNRGRLQQGLAGLKSLPANANAFDVVSSLIAATQGIPGSERYVGSLIEPLLADLQSRQKASGGIGEATTRGVGNISSQVGPEEFRQGVTPSSEQIQSLLGEKYFPNIQQQGKTEYPESFKPQKPLTAPLPIGPGEEAKIRSKLRELGIVNASVIDDTIEKTRKYQKDYYAAQKEGFSNIEDFQKARLQKDQDFFSGADLMLGQAHGQQTPAEKSIWRELSREYEDLSDTERFANTEQKYNQLVGDPLIEFENSQMGLPFGSAYRPREVANRLEDAKSTIKDHLRRIEERPELSSNLKGLIKNELRDQYMTAMASKDYGVAQSAYSIYDLSDKAANAIPKVPLIGLNVQISGGESFSGTSKPSKIEQEKFTYSLANALTQLSPTDSLILAREKAIQNNYDSRSFNDALNIAINSGRLKLSDFQAKEKPKLSLPQRLDLDSIMEGKRSVYDLKKGKK